MDSLNLRDEFIHLVDCCGVVCGVPIDCQIVDHIISTESQCGTRVIQLLLQCWERDCIMGVM